MTVDLPFSPTGIAHFVFPYDVSNAFGELIGKVKEVICIPYSVKPEFGITLSVDYKPNNEFDVNTLNDVIEKINREENDKRIGKWKLTI